MSLAPKRIALWEPSQPPSIAPAAMQRPRSQSICPPRAKKWSSAPTRSSPSTSAQIPATSSSAAVDGATQAAVVEALADRYPVTVVRVGIQDRFAETGPYFALLDRYGCAVADVVSAAKRSVGLKKER